MKELKEMISQMLREAADRIDNGSCEVGDEDMYNSLKTILHVPISKTDAREYLGLSRTTFDYQVNKGYLPHGQKRRGFNELVWYKDELEKYKHAKLDDKSTKESM
jgi:hypothetical protein